MEAEVTQDMEIPMEPPTTPASPEARRQLARTFDTLVESNLRLTESLGGLIASVEKLLKFQVVVFAVVMIGFVVMMVRGK